mgnify:CR=1 FL=1
MMIQDQDGPMQFEFQVTLKKVAHKASRTEAPGADPRPHSLVRTLVQAHRIEALLQEGRIRDHAGAARFLGVSRPRVAQIVGFLRLAPAIQEAILNASPERLGSLTARQMRRIAAVPDWAEQAALFNL